MLQVEREGASTRMVSVAPSLASFAPGGRGGQRKVAGSDQRASSGPTISAQCMWIALLAKPRAFSAGSIALSSKVERGCAPRRSRAAFAGPSA